MGTDWTQRGPKRTQAQRSPVWAAKTFHSLIFACDKLKLAPLSLFGVSLIMLSTTLSLFGALLCLFGAPSEIGMANLATFVSFNK